MNNENEKDTNIEEQKNKDCRKIQLGVRLSITSLILLIVGVIAFVLSITHVIPQYVSGFCALFSVFFVIIGIILSTISTILAPKEKLVKIIFFVYIFLEISFIIYLVYIMYCCAEALSHCPG